MKHSRDGVLLKHYLAWVGKSIANEFVNCQSDREDMNVDVRGLALWNRTDSILESLKEAVVDYLTERGLSNVTQLNQEELKALGCAPWNEGATKDLMLLTPFLFQMVPDGTQLTTIFGEHVVKGMAKIDMDTRMGVLSYGLMTEEV